MGTMVFGCTGMIFFTGALVQLFTLRPLQDIVGNPRRRSRRLERQLYDGGTVQIWHLGLLRPRHWSSADFATIQNEVAISRPGV
jgi:hypothetical protein